MYSRRFGKWKDTYKNGQDFFNMESRRSRKKNKMLLNIIQYGNTSEWDCTCLFFALLYSDSFGPVLTPTVASNINDLRVFRNGFFAHLSQPSVLDADFRANVQLVSNAFTALNLDTKELQNISNQGSFPTAELQKLQEQICILEEEIQGKAQSFMFLPVKPSHAVTERKAEVEDIMQMFIDLQNKNDEGSIVTVFVSGNPGCGKSQIARQVGEKFAADNQDGSTFVMTLNAESERSMLVSYMKFARALGVTEYSITSITGVDSKLTERDQILHLIALVSAKVKEYSTWLLIFDNVDELESLRGFWPQEEEWGDCGQVLVTTQDSIYVPFSDPFCEEVFLSAGMQTNDALHLLRSICEFSSEDEEDEHSVLKALDYQPLAIASAALYVRYLQDAGGITAVPGSATWKNYLKKLAMGKRNLTEEIYERTSKSYPSSMTSAVSLAVQKLVQNRVFRHVVHFLALCAPAPVGLDMIVRFVMKQDPGLDEDMTAAEISRCCLLMQLPLEDSSSRLMKVHQVVHDVFKSNSLAKCSDKEVSLLTQSYIDTLSTFAEHNVLQFDLKFHFCSKMMAPHLKVFSSHLKASNFNPITSDQRNLCKKALLNFGDICSAHGYLPAAKTYFENALQIANDKRGGNQDKMNVTATILNNLGVVYWKLGQFERAKDYHQQALDLIGILNPITPSPEIADSLNKLGNVCFSLGQFETAKDLYSKSLTIREELHGKEDATVVVSLNNLGSVHSVLGDPHTAKDFYQRSLDLAEKTYGLVHPRVADCYCNLGIVHSELYLTSEAIEYHNKALEMRKELYFPEHFLISESYNNIGLMYKAQGQLVKAMDCYKSALQIREKTLDEEHPAMAELLSNLGQLYMDLGEMQKSKDCHFRARNIRNKILSCDHCQLGDTMLNLGMVFEQCSDLDNAADYFQRALTIYSKSFPRSHRLCQSADEGFKRVLQQQADLNNQRGSLQSRSSLVMAVRRSKILNYPFSGAHWERRQMNAARTKSLDDYIVLFALSLIGQYVKDYVRDPEDGVLKTLWLSIPYVVAVYVIVMAIEADYVGEEFKLLRVLKFLGFLYILGYCFQSYL